VYVLVGAAVFIEYRRRVPPLQRDVIFYAFCINTILTGITSGWFHATLIYTAQKADEFFENAAVLSLMYFHIMRKGGGRPASKRYFIYSLHVTLLAIGVLCVPEVFCEVHLILIVLVCFGRALYTIKSLPDGSAKTGIRSQFTKSFTAAGVSFAFWLVDFLLCSSFVRSLNLHAFCWHFGTAAALLWGGTGSMELGLEVWAKKRGVEGSYKSG